MEHDESSRRLSFCAVWAALAVLTTSVAAATCPETNQPAPAVVTVIASSGNPVEDAQIASPTCSVKTITRGSVTTFTINNLGVERVDSVPSNIKMMISKDNALSQGADVSAATGMETLTIYTSSISSNFASWALPAALVNFGMSGDAVVSSFEGLKFPSSLVYLNLYNTPNFKTLKNVQLPPKLRQFGAVTTKLTAVDIQYLPAALEELAFVASPIGDLVSVPLPRSLNIFNCQDCETTSIRGVQFPSSLSTLVFQQTTAITAFEIRETDLKTFQSLSRFNAPVTQTSCSGSGELKGIQGVKVCVISDSEFERRYGNSPATLSPSSPVEGSDLTILPSAFKRGDSSSKSSSSQDDASPTSTGNTTVAGVSSDATSYGSRANGSLSSTHEESNVGGLGGSQVPGNQISSSGRPTPEPTSEVVDVQIKRSAHNTSLIAITVTSILTVVVAALLFYVFVVRKRRRLNTSTETPTTSKFHRVDTPSSSMDKNPSSGKNPSSEPTITPSEPDTLAIDFRNDKELVRHRIDQVHVGKQVARGGFGVVYRGTCEGRVVAVKQMLPDAWRSDSMIADFLDEIRMCARLDHPKIVAFIGVSWNSLRDLSVITEFMDGGDLHSVLHMYRESSGAEWKNPWGGSSLRSKTLMAMDVAEAVVYLHSFDTPIIHRDLKAKNVLLDRVGNAKLSDFGISRDVSMDETMTSEIGTAAWIAPEVLRGERYSEKADIYSLGVLLVELDRCRHPYADEPVLLMGSATTHQRRNQNGNSSRVAHKNTQIAVLVSTGKLKPSVSRECPPVVASVIESCLRFEASERPTAMEAFYGLRQIRKQHEAASTVE